MSDAPVTRLSSYIISYSLGFSFLMLGPNKNFGLLITRGFIFGICVSIMCWINL